MEVEASVCVRQGTPEVAERPEAKRIHGHMKKPRAIMTFVVCLILVLAFVSVGCGDAYDHDLVGVWIPADSPVELEIEFRSDGTMLLRQPNFGESQIDYAVKDGQLSLLDPDTNEVTQRHYSVVGDILTIEREDGPNATFVRKK